MPLLYPIFDAHHGFGEPSFTAPEHDFFEREEGEGVYLFPVDGLCDWFVPKGSEEALVCFSCGDRMVKGSEHPICARELPAEVGFYGLPELVHVQIFCQWGVASVKGVQKAFPQDDGCVCGVVPPQALAYGDMSETFSP